MYILRKRARKSKNIIFLHFMTPFQIFVLKIETDWLKGWFSQLWKLEMSIFSYMYGLLIFGYKI